MAVVTDNKRHAGALSQLLVDIRQTSISPPSLTLKVTNGYTIPLTILKWDSPLDPLAIQLGLLSITLETADEPLDLPTIQIRRVMPPPPDSIITLQPGESKEQEVVLREPIVPLSMMTGTVKIKCKGTWMSVWPMTADKLTTNTLEMLQAGDQVLTGDYETGSIDVKIT